MVENFLGVYQFPLYKKLNYIYVNLHKTFENYMTQILKTSIEDSYIYLK